MRKLVPLRMRGRRRGRVAIVAALTMCVAVVGVASAAVGGFNPFGTEQVSQTYANGILLPTNQWISPLGTRIVDGSATQQGARLVSSAISPDGRYLAALGWNNFQGFLTIFDLKTGTMVQQTPLNTDGGNDPTVAADGPLFSPDSATGGSTLWVPQSEFLLEVQLRRQHRGSHSRGHADLPVWEQRQPCGPRHRPRCLHVLQRLRRRRRVRREQRASVRRRQRRRAAVRDGALVGRVEALRGAQRRQQASRDRHCQRHRARRNPRR